jgi:hypothetical protein
LNEGASVVVAKSHFNYVSPDEYARRDKAGGIWARDPNDWYIEPAWTSKRLFESENFDGAICDPACGIGTIVISARAAGFASVGYDVVHRSAECSHVRDFLSDDWAGVTSNFVSNPPFGPADKFVKLALERARGKVVMLLPATWHFGSKRAAWLKTTPLRRVLALTPRPSMPPGAVIVSGQKPGGGMKDFAWYIWERGYSGPWEGGWLQRDAS